MSRYTEFTDLATADGMVVLDWRHRLVDPSGAIVASTDETDGALVWGAQLRPLVYDRRGASNRLSTLVVPAADQSLVPDAAGWLHPDSGYRIVIEAGLVVDGVANYQVQATMLPEVVTADDTGVIDLTVETVDTSRPVRSELETGFRFDDGETVSAVVDRLLGQVLDEGAYEVAGTTHTTPSGSIGAGQKRDQFVNELLIGIGHELTTTPDGLVITRPIPPSADDPGAEVWRYGQSDGIPVDKAARRWTVKTPQAWRVEGGSFQDPGPAITFTVYDTDPSSAGYFDGVKPAQIKTTRAPFITNLAQAAEAGYGQLRINGVGPMEIDIYSVPNPGVRVGDIVELERPDLNASGRFRIVDYSLPMQNESQMRLSLRKVYDPALNFIPPNPGNESCVASHTDDFNRADENLENLPPGSPGSPDWEEIGWSWAIVNATAMQRFHDGWSLAVRKAPLCAYNQYAEFDVSAIPSGRYVGPCVRSGAKTINGYMFLASSSGRLTLERWINGRRAATLASVDYGSVVGSTMRIEAEGRTIRGKVNGTTIVDATDDKATGTFVGMLGYGGHQPHGPAVTNFDAGAL